MIFPSDLLEHLRNTVTQPGNEHGAAFEVAKCHCRCWFCPDCCKMMGYNLRAKLIPILETFDGLLMVSLTVDPKLFADPKTAYFYMMDRRCVGRTTQDLFRWHYLYTRRYFYVVEWQKNTEQAHFHLLLDTSYIPWDSLLASWSKHRPPQAGAVIGNRPAFGTVIFSMPYFEGGAEHAARYATKYLIKTPEHGFPLWVLEMGKDRRIRRFSTSRGFWNTPAKPRIETTVSSIKRKSHPYMDRIASCGQAVNVFEVNRIIDRETGEMIPARSWVGQLDAEASTVMANLYDPGNPDRPRRSLLAQSPGHAKKIIDIATGRESQWLRYRNLGNKKINL